MARRKVSQGTLAPNIEPANDRIMVSMMQGDVAYMIGELRQVFVCVLSALRRLRTVQIMLTATARCGAS